MFSYVLSSCSPTSETPPPPLPLQHLCDFPYFKTASVSQQNVKSKATNVSRLDHSDKSQMPFSRFTNKKLNRFELTESRQLVLSSRIHVLHPISLLAQVVLSEVAAAAPQLNLRIGFVGGRLCAQTPHGRLSFVFVLVSEFQQDVAGSRTTRHGKARQNKTNQAKPSQDMT